MVDIPLDGGHATVQCTDDGGTTWTGTSFPPPPDGLGTGPEDVGLLNADDGWLTIGIGSTSQAALYLTSDGGHTWTPVADVPLGLLTFTTPTDAFDVAASGGLLYRSTDAGLHWSPVSLPLPSRWRTPGGPPSLNIGLPTFFGLSGVLPVQNISTHAIGVETTTDGGATWVAGLGAPAYPAPAVTGVGSGAFAADSFPFEALSGDTWVVWLGRSLSLTTDAGANWTVVSDRALPFSFVIDGWATGEQQIGLHRYLYVLVHTTDGGARVTLVDWPGGREVHSIPELPGIALAGTSVAGHTFTP